MKMRVFCSLLFVIWFLTGNVSSQGLHLDNLVKAALAQKPADSVPSKPDTTVLNHTDSAKVNLIDTTVLIPQLEFVGLKLDDALKALVRAYRLSVFIDSSVTGTITLRLENVSLNDALLFIIKQYNLAWEKTGDITKIYKPVPPPPIPAPLDMTIQNGLLSCQLKNVDISRFVNEVIGQAKINIVIENGAAGLITGRLEKVPLEKALNTLLTSNGFKLSSADGIYYVGIMKSEGAESGRASRFSISCENSLVTLNVSNAPLSDVISAIGDKCGASFFIRGKIDGRVSAAFTAMPLDNTLASLLRNTSYTFKHENDVYFIGDKNSEDMFVSELILLKHLVAKDVEPLIPASLTRQVTLKIVIEQNGFIVVGPKTIIDEIREFLNTVDVPTAMVLFDVLVVDYTNTDAFQFDVLMNSSGNSTNLPGQIYYPNIDISGTGKNLNDEFDYLKSHLGITNMGPLSSDFFARLQILQQQGKANVRSRPRIASLCGHPASINVGTTQYYLLTSKTVYPSTQSDVSTQTAQRFETIEANMSIQVTPYVNATGELIVDVNPEFSTPAAAFNPDIPPTINHRVLKSTVRLKDGETIILGGLVQTTETATIKKFPLLGSLPLLGPLFSSTQKTTVKSELMIYITPHVYYGSENQVDLNKLYKKE